MGSATAIDFLYLNEQDTIAAGVTEMAACIDTMEEVFSLLEQGDFVMGGTHGDSHGLMLTFPPSSPFPNMPTSGADRRFMAMPAYIGGSFDTVGMKWYGSNTENRERGLPRSIHLLTLCDKVTGAPIGLMSANLLSAYRTGAVSGVAVRHLATAEARTLAVVGAGVIARTSIEAILHERPEITTVKIKGRSQAGVRRLAEHIRQAHPGVSTVVACDSIQDAVTDADVILIAATGLRGTANYPFIDERWIRPGALLCVPANLELDTGFLLDRARTVVDHFPLYEAWAAENTAPVHEFIGIIGTKFIDLVNEGRMSRAEVPSLGALIRGAAPVREHDDQVVVLSIGGMPVEDVAWGTTVLRRARQQELGTRLDLWAAPALV